MKDACLAYSIGRSQWNCFQPNFGAYEGWDYVGFVHNLIIPSI